MAKDTYYFSHDYNARSDKEMMKVRMKMGMTGIGLYWCIVEMLYEEGGYLNRSEYERIAFELQSNCNDITTLIEEFKLFKFDNEMFWSDSALERLNKRKDKSDKARESVRKRWDNTNVLQSNNAPNTIKERKGEEKKEKENTTVGAGEPAKINNPRTRISRKKLDAESYWANLIKVYYSFCYEKFNEKPSFSGSDPHDMHEIIRSLKQRAADQKVEWTEEIAMLRWREFLGRAFQDEWLSKNWLLSNLDRQKNKVFLNLISHKNGTHQQQASSVGKTIEFD